MEGERKAIEFQSAGDVARVMSEVVANWREQPLMTCLNLRSAIPFAQALETLAKEIEELKSRLPTPVNGRPKK